MARTTRTLWITSISPEVISGRQYVPTAIHYGDQVSIGADANDAADDAIVNYGFKVDIGDITPGQSPRMRKLTECDDGKARSAFEITKDYIDLLFHGVQHRLPHPAQENGQVPARLLVAEPLSFQADGRHPDWLSNYRQNLRRILSSFDSIEFLPEPFAVYQYYRHGLNLPSLADNSKHIALIIDFGGGTFDISIIETTRDGDVSLTGKHAKPLGASSTPFGGLYINRQIAEYLIKRPLPESRRSEVDRCIRNFDQWRNGQHTKGDFREPTQRFIDNFVLLERLCESYKLAMSGTVSDWRIAVEAYESIRVKVPRDPFSDSEWIDIDFRAHQFRSIFVDRIWNQHLKPAVRKVFDRARGELRSRTIDVTLVSGGSANIGWLRSLLIQDFGDELADAIPVGIQHSFQDVVANGLAIECARRHYNDGEDEDSEFVAVTYNPIRLLLGANGEVPGPYRFRSVDDDIDMRDAAAGDLIPAAQSLRHFFGRRLAWRVKLPTRPSRSLEYLFYRPDEGDRQDSEDAPDATAFNVEQTIVYPVKGGGFDNRMTVEMTFREDGTATPRFVYQAGNPDRGIPQHSREVRPFFIDMTTSVGSTNQANYVGFDFGTSNSAICCLSNSVIETTRAKGASSSWRGMNDAIALLPFPVAIAVRKYLSCQDSADIFDAALAAYEACLAMLAFCMAAEAIHLHSSLGPILLKPFQHRSLGPLLALLAQSSRRLRHDGNYFGRGAITDDALRSFEDTNRNFNNVKHHKADKSSFDCHEHLEHMVHLVVKCFEGLMFGYCATSEPVPLSSSGHHRGAFVVAHDCQPFVEHRNYASTRPIDRSVALVVDPQRQCALSVTPLFVWLDDGTQDDRSCYLVDNLGWDGKPPLLKPCHRKDVAEAGVLLQDIVPLLEGLRDNGRLFLGSVDLALSAPQDDIGLA